MRCSFRRLGVSDSTNPDFYLPGHFVVTVYLLFATQSRFHVSITNRLAPPAMVLWEAP